MAAIRPLVRLGKDVYLVRAPQLEGAAAKKGGPECVILFGWMDGELEAVKPARRKSSLFPIAHSSDEASTEVSQFVSHSRQSFWRARTRSARLTSLRLSQFPQTDILLLRSHQTSFYRPSSYIRKALSPAAEHLRSTYPSARPGKDSPILVHIWSNGGCLGLRALNEMMMKAEIGSEEAKRPLLAAEGRSGIPARAFIFDSCPGLSTLQATILAFTAPLRSRFTRWPATALVTLVYAIGKLYSL